jgi:hypothetical protein
LGLNDFHNLIERAKDGKKRMIDYLTDLRKSVDKPKKAGKDTSHLINIDNFQPMGMYEIKARRLLKSRIKTKIMVKKVPYKFQRKI